MAGPEVLGVLNAGDHINKRIGGTGLGLAIVKHICAISDAEFSIESEFGVGTTVTVVFSK